MMWRRLLRQPNRFYSPPLVVVYLRLSQTNYRIFFIIPISDTQRMGTRGLIRLCDDQGQVYAIVYSQLDSYPQGLGAKLYRFLHEFTISNGMEMKAPMLYSMRKYTEFLDFLQQPEQQMHTEPQIHRVLLEAATQARDAAKKRADLITFDRSSTLKQANGIGCLYAQLIAHLKVTLGSIYLEPVYTRERVHDLLQEYKYDIVLDESGNITVGVTGHGLTGEAMDLEAFATLCGVAG
jgi:hypothetical protein